MKSWQVRCTVVAILQSPPFLLFINKCRPGNIAAEIFPLNCSYAEDHGSE